MYLTMLKLNKCYVMLCYVNSRTSLDKSLLGYIILCKNFLPIV